jgi:hypothetical protein
MGGIVICQDTWTCKLCPRLRFLRKGERK